MNTSLLHYAFNMRGMDYCGCEHKGNTIHIKHQFRKEEIRRNSLSSLWIASLSREIQKIVN